MLNNEKNIIERAIQVNEQKLTFDETSNVLIDIFNDYEKDIDKIITYIKSEIKNTKKYNGIFDIPNSVIFNYMLKTIWKEGFIFDTFSSYKEYIYILNESEIKELLDKTYESYKKDIDKLFII